MNERLKRSRASKNDFLLNEKAGICKLFANVFAKEPTVEFLRQLQSRENEKLLKSCGMDCLSDIEHLSLEKQADRLAIEYARLFLTSGRSSSPHESVQLGEGRFWGQLTVEVNSIYKKFGFVSDDSFKDMPDHLSAELSFLAQLYLLELEYTGGGMADAVRGVLEVRKYFLRNHLLKWFFGFRDEVVKDAKFSYYREMVEFLGAFLNQEFEDLKGVKDIRAGLIEKGSVG